MTERPTRREFITRGGGAVLAAGVAAAGGYLLHDSRGEAGQRAMSSPVSCVRNFFADVELPTSTPRICISTGDQQQIDRLVRAAVRELDPDRGVRRFIAPGDVVLIKPNAGFDRPPQLGATTHPEVIRALVRLCHEAGARQVRITDNPIESPAACFARSGIAAVARDENARIIFPRQNDFEVHTLRDCRASVSRGEAFAHWPVLSAPFAGTTKLIGVAPVKDHNLAGASMILKNWYGLLGGRRNQLHQVIHETISDLALMVSPTLVVADGTRVMLRNGPTGGRLTDVQPGGVLGHCAIVVSVDPVACDAWCFENLLGRDPARLPYLDLASRKIRAQTNAGHRRLGERDWRSYERRGQLASIRL